jgi:hypothetical protein
MDPLSITASVLAIIAGVQQALKGIQTLRSLKNCPEDWLALSNEVSDLGILVNQVDALSSRLQGRDDDGAVSALRVHMNRANEKLQALNASIHEDLVKRVGHDLTRISRWAWVRNEGKVRAAIQDLRNVRGNIGVALGTITSYVIMIPTFYSKRRVVL